MPIDPKITPRRARLEKTVNDVLIAANGCLALTAIVLASLLLVERQVASWQVSGSDLPARLEMVKEPS
jgi:hypothetical protein